MLRYLFLDMNAYFASVEQQSRPELRGQPVGIAAVRAGTTCCIAASYEAKAYGVKTGTLVRDARRLCPSIRIVQARPALYVSYHKRIRKAVEMVLPVHHVASIDEMCCRLMGNEQRPDVARRLAGDVRQSIKDNAGVALRCSIGIAPNNWLAKVASDMQKPEGLTIITTDDLPRCLYRLELGDLTGIGKRMLRRLNSRGVYSVKQLCALSERQLSTIWGGRAHGLAWYAALRGEDIPIAKTKRATVGHSHVLPPEFRSMTQARSVAARQLHKASIRLRAMHYHTRRVTVFLKFLGRSPWLRELKVPACRDTSTLLEALDHLWQEAPAHGTPIRVDVTLTDLVPDVELGPLLSEMHTRNALADTLDEINLRYGKPSMFYGVEWGALESAPMRIAFTRVPKLDEFRF